jgi:8-oxo-dGTP pyrophosphatase MutT (NUDIX family)
MVKVVSCGVVMLNARREVFACHTTGTPRWDLPKGVQDPGESALQTALREVWEETSLALEPQMLCDLGLYDYLPAKRLHLHALRVAVDAFRIDACRFSASRHWLADARSRCLCMETAGPARRLVRQEHDSGAAGARLAAHRAAA